MLVTRWRIRSSATLVALIALAAGAICIASAWLVKSIVHDRNQSDLNKGLIAAIKESNYAKIASILDRGADPNRRCADGARPTPLLVALGDNDEYDGATSYTGSRDTLLVVRILCQHGANVNTRDANGWTPLMFAVAHGKLGTARLIICNGADVNLRNEDRATALLMAPSETAIYHLLLDHGADVNAQDMLSGDTPLIRTVRTGDVEIVRYLLGKGANIALRNRDGESAVDVARKRNTEKGGQGTFHRLIEILSSKKS